MNLDIFVAWLFGVLCGAVALAVLVVWMRWMMGI